MRNGVMRGFRPIHSSWYSCVQIQRSLNMKGFPESEDLDGDDTPPFAVADPETTKKGSCICITVVSVMAVLTVWLLVIIAQHPEVVKIIEDWLPTYSTRIDAVFNTTDEMIRGAHTLLQAVTLRGDREGISFVKHAATPSDMQTHTINHLQAMSTIALAHFNCTQVIHFDCVNAVGGMTIRRPRKQPIPSSRVKFCRTGEFLVQHSGHWSQPYLNTHRSCCSGPATCAMTSEEYPWKCSPWKQSQTVVRIRINKNS